MRYSRPRPRLLAGVAVLGATAAMLLVPAQQATAKAVPECGAGGVKVNAGESPATVTVNDTTTTGTSVQVIVTITGTRFTVTPVGSAVTLTSATWCLKASTKTQDGTGTTGTSAIKNSNNVAQKISYVTIYNVTTGFVSRCLMSTPSPQLIDLLITGPANTLDQVEFHQSINGSCSGSHTFNGTIVTASDQSSALIACDNIGRPGLSILRPMNFNYPGADADWWLCGTTTTP
jgi:hypothetical protein